ncbi:hypothetical protein HDU97_006811 [Phlyctochytrium planicorne]|nr:hypothetical protein HDU97_006811 [Phlyctochytrium planicorne]
MKFLTATTAAAMVSMFASSADARFGQGGNVKLGTKLRASGCGNFGQFGGKEIGTLLAGADPCDKLKLADSVLDVAAKDCAGTEAFGLVVEAAMDLVSAERNFNPFKTKEDSICTDAAFPANPILQGILQFVDPRKGDPVASAFNKKVQDTLDKAKADKKGPGNKGKSIAELSAENGFALIQNFDGKAVVVDPPPVKNGGNTGTGTNTGEINTENGTGKTGGTGDNILGTCSADAAKLVIKLGADPDGDRINEVRAIPGGFRTDKIFGGQSSALKFAIVANFICDRIGNECKGDRGTCKAAQAKFEALGLKGGKGLSDAQIAAAQKAASDFNKAIGIDDGLGGNGLQGEGDGEGDGKGTGKGGNKNGGGKKGDAEAQDEQITKAESLIQEALDVLTKIAGKRR